MNSHEKMQVLIDMVKSGVYPVIRWIPCSVSISELYGYDIGMICRVVNVILKESYSEDDCHVYQVTTDFSEFEEFNKQFSRATYYDKNSVPCLHWYQTKLYPKNKIETVFMQISSTQDSSGDMFEFVDLDRLKWFEEFKASGQNSYISWLENKLENFSK